MPTMLVESKNTGRVSKNKDNALCVTTVNTWGFVPLTVQIAQWHVHTDNTYALPTVSMQQAGMYVVLDPIPPCPHHGQANRSSLPTTRFIMFPCSCKHVLDVYKLSGCVI